MGLAAPRNRTKIPADPRNTHWATNTTNFGHRLLTAHGWIPGSTLGDTTSSYYASGHISEASSTGVKITLKGNNLGIGCKGGIKDDECTGLDIFQDLLGRLNGKEEEVEERVQKRKMELITGRYGMKFVRGEMYVSSDVDTLIENIRKAKEEKAEIAKETEREERRRKKKERKAAKASKVEQEDQAEESPASPPAQELSKKEKKEKKKDKKAESSTPAPTSSSSDSESKSKKRKRTDDDSKKSRRSKKDKKEKKDKKKRSKESSETETPPSASDTSTPTVLTGRHAIRHRYIAAKRSAVMDTKALNEIFMIKA